MLKIKLVKQAQDDRYKSDTQYEQFCKVLTSNSLLKKDHFNFTEKYKDKITLILIDHFKRPLLIDHFNYVSKKKRPL